MIIFFVFCMGLYYCLLSRNVKCWRMSVTAARCVHVLGWLLCMHKWLEFYIYQHISHCISIAFNYLSIFSDQLSSFSHLSVAIFCQNFQTWVKKLISDEAIFFLWHPWCIFFPVTSLPSLFSPSQSDDNKTLPVIRQWISF